VGSALGCDVVGLWLASYFVLVSAKRHRWSGSEKGRSEDKGERTEGEARASEDREQRMREAG